MMQEFTLEERFERADKMHASGGNCAQSVSYALSDLADVDERTLFRMTEGFGAGMGCMEGTCGAVSGAVAVAGLINSSGSTSSITKAGTYKLAGRIVKEFKNQAGSLICKEIKNSGGGQALMDCHECIRQAVRIGVDVLAGEDTV